MINVTAYGDLRACVLILSRTTSCWPTIDRVTIKSDGTHGCLIHPRDIIRTALAVLEAPDDVVHNHTFNVGQPPENYRIRELATRFPIERCWAVRDVGFKCHP